ncbi:KEOPS complex subunit Cgi121 [Natronolimnohabitans innermongolicus]|uniref:KEOPS complex Cgi121-like subunit n=1 Tax=Natronolimnohabitans innermongolicus JCM 12255 TaxID=1227499 RepID=L9WZN5_9EURY|nr:KEOPS complex subunit Cgi121 [Natronolimnohabitans innermongolicus]ELY54852.1 KEOPS complex Cgi121-like subunit [Natronolimnohabitans innermongolicus JCM 12255]
MELFECTLAIDDLDAFVADIGAIGDRHGVTIQAFDADYIADRAHLERARDLADRAIDRGENVARDRAVEILLYAAGRRQIDRALEMGVDEGETRAVVLVDGSTGNEGVHEGNGSDSTADNDRERQGERAALEALTALEAVGDCEPTLESRDEVTLCAFFEITEAEREATDADLGDLVRERVALLEVEK